MGYRIVWGFRHNKRVMAYHLNSHLRTELESGKEFLKQLQFLNLTKVRIQMDHMQFDQDYKLPRNERNELNVIDIISGGRYNLGGNELVELDLEDYHYCNADAGVIYIFNLDSEKLHIITGHKETEFELSDPIDWKDVTGRTE